ncbi:hypothetical protein GRX03_08495 [Halovenus sp. WSH3]|uniref:Uncharacterized protein n=1 Tax=Halovenus carboxidivorans TaxID=2692199 RepID=A0A6B0T9U0_9EURY|nr:hypothetical protein [Halovenus carboxidivorans]MXR51640.1 hypothetical protein [Halovenus carboxidivorans]
MNRRGQTAYDYLLGIVLLLVTIITVLSLFPQVFGPFVEPVSSDQEKMADRVASDVIETTALGGTERTINASELDDLAVEQAKSEAGLREIRSVNVSLQRGAEPVVGAGDRQRDGEPSAVVVRTVQTAEGGACRTGCQLVVRVW